jgi:ADP-heptose:LPS heptosyltransferase
VATRCVDAAARSSSFAGAVRKLILKCGFSPGDVVMLTAAVRDLHQWYPGRFLTDVRTLCPDLWQSNPHVTAISDDDPEAEKIDCKIPLINQSNQTPYHCLHGYIEFLNQYLSLNIKPTAFKGDIHLSEQEKAWYSQVHEVTGEKIPFWVIAAGGKYDLTIKWWQSSRYQEVVNHFRGKIQFVQVGKHGHHHTKLDGVIDVRGQTTLRELVRLVYHSQGVLCSITALMHLAAAVDTKPSQPPNRPCVVIAGGREPPHWEAYPHHQFIHTVGALPCCKNGGCWRDRTIRLRDGDRRDRPENLCVDVVDELPRCMDLITPEEVIRRIEGYFLGGVIKYLSPQQRQAGERGIAATSRNPIDQQPLNLSSAGIACERFINTIPSYPHRYDGRGIVICGGGVRYFTNAWVCVNMLRWLGCTLPIQLWHLGKKEMDNRMKTLVAPLGVECVDAMRVRKKFPMRILKGWEMKSYAMFHSPYREVLLLDADNMPVVNPEFLFSTAGFRATGAIFWPDFLRGKDKKAMAIWRSFGLRMPDELEFETGQIVLDKERCWRALCLSLWINENSDFFYQHLYGDKETFHLAFRKLKTPYLLIQKPIQRLEGVMCQHDFLGRRVFQHRNMAKWDLFFNKRVNGFRFEKECHGHIDDLRRAWNGQINFPANWKRMADSRRIGRTIRIEAVMISCMERNEVRRRTLENLARTDWGDMPLHIHFDTPDGGTPIERQVQSSCVALKKSLDYRADYILFLEDDVDFNRHIRHNLRNWAPVTSGAVTLAGLYNPRLREKAWDLKSNARIVDPNSAYGSQALLLSKETVEYVVRRWDDVPGGQDIKMTRLAGRLGKPIFYHAPSLVQHMGTRSTWGGGFHQASDFDPVWKA